MPYDLANLPFTIADLHEAYAAGLDPARVVDEVFRRLEAAADPGIFIAAAAPEALRAAAAALGRFDPSRPLWGIPVAVKDNIDVLGQPTTAACPEFAYQPKADAESVARLRAAGALLVGKTNLDQFATGLVGLRTPYPVPRNTFDPNLVPGGSSSGSAVAVALGIVAVALGTDTAGSGRVPAALNNIVGLKPTRGAVSIRGLVPACRSLDCISVFALTVGDAWETFAVLAGYDPADPFSRQLPTPSVTALPPRFRLGVPQPDDRPLRDEAARAAFDAALSTAESLGVEIVELPFDDFFKVGTLLYGGPWVGERYAAVRAIIGEQPDALLPVTREIIASAASFSAADTFDAAYKLQDLIRRTEPVWAEIDMLCVPSIPGLATVAEVQADPFAANARLGTYTNFVNLLDLSALAVPAGMRSDGAPNGVTLIARAGQDGHLAAFGDALHRAMNHTLGATSWPLAAEPLPATEDAADMIPILVLGAHLSGLPLNPELVAAGGVFFSEAITAPDYRMHLLAGTVARPGLVRTGPGRGQTILGEIWLLPPAGFGRFVAGVVAPLTIGTVRLADGGTVKGFLAETEGVRGCPDISSFGGWRAYLARERALQTAT